MIPRVGSDAENASVRAYYNEFDPYAAQWLRNLMAKGLIPAGDVDERSIVDVAPDDLTGYRQCHFFAGIGGWALAARLAGWPDDRELWTGSPPCQPFSVAGKGKAQADDRHLWPHLFRLASARRPAVLMGEQVAAAVGKHWLDGVFADLEGIGYACGAVVVPACAVDAPHRRDRLWFVARDGAVGDGIGAGLEGHAGHGGAAAGRTDAHRPASTAGGGGDVAVTRGDGHDPANLNAAEPRYNRQDDGLPVGGSGELRGGARDGDVADACLGRCGEPEARQVQQPGRAEAVGGGEAGDLADAYGYRCGARKWDDQAAGYRDPATAAGVASAWSGAAWIIGHDGKARRVGTRIRRVVDGLSAGMVGVRPDGDAEEVEMIPMLERGAVARVGKLRAFGNAIVPQVAAEVIGAYMDCMP